ncbi:AI-2E family transporter [Aeoliella sp.]|uniref:AI-2E family transporter n=1 Tax=Aeoliella sp. TaxID=2795800 RepID=UPI003CCBC6DC
MSLPSSPTSDEPAPAPSVQHVRIDVLPRRAESSEEVSIEASAAEDADPARRITEKTCLIVLTVLAVFYTLYFARAILLPTTMAIVLSLVLKPLTKRIGKFGLPDVVSTILVMTAFSILLALGARALWKPANQWIEQFPKSIKQIREEVSSSAGPLANLMKAKSEVEKLTSVPEQEAEASDSLLPLPKLQVEVEQPPLTNRMLSSTGSFATACIVTLSLLFFLLAAGDRFLEKAIQVRRTWREKRDLVMLIKEVERKMSAYLGAITFINIGLGIVIGIGMWLIGLPNPLLWGVVAAMLNYIPFAGLIIGTLTVFVVAIGEFENLGHALLAPAIYLGVNGIEANLITPVVLGRSISLNPVVILLAVFLAGWIWGIGGIFLSVPLLLMAKIACDAHESLEPISVFLAK